MYIFNPERLTIRDFAPDGEQQPFVKGHIFCIKQDAEGNLWIGTSQGVYCYKDGRQVAHYTSSNSRLPEGNVYEIYLTLPVKDGFVRKWRMYLGPFF